MTDYYLQISAHGQQPAYGSTFKLPEGYTIKFFVAEGDDLDWDTSVQIYKYLAKEDFDSVNKLVKHTLNGGDTVINYNLWDLQDSAYVSGTLQAGKSTATVSIAGKTSEAYPITLANLLKATVAKLGAGGSGNTFVWYFNACRSF